MAASSVGASHATLPPGAALTWSKHERKIEALRLGLRPRVQELLEAPSPLTSLDSDPHGLTLPNVSAPRQPDGDRRCLVRSDPDA